MAKPKYNLEDLRAKCRGYGNVGVGARQLEFVLSELDAQKGRADAAERAAEALQERVEAYQWLLEVEQVNLWYGAPIDSDCLVNALEDYRRIVACAKKAVETDTGA